MIGYNTVGGALDEAPEIFSGPATERRKEPRKKIMTKKLTKDKASPFKRSIQEELVKKHRHHIA